MILEWLVGLILIIVFFGGIALVAFAVSPFMGFGVLAVYAFMYAKSRY